VSAPPLIDLAVRDIVARVTDPEIPVLTIDDLGVLRSVTVDADGHVEVTITPTYSGCPAMDVIRTDIQRTLAEHGYGDAAVRTVLAPAWTTDWISDEGRRKLNDYGIAPPAPTSDGPAAVDLVRCPQCGSAATKLVSRFGSTACLSQRSCRRCLEPFDHFRAL
jgi:ring-1,2-phenylacetyl-CoA epoxidase subunit PaaD